MNYSYPLCIRVEKLCIIGKISIYSYSSEYVADKASSFTRDGGEGITITWNTSGKVKSVTGDSSPLDFSYSALGQRQMKAYLADGAKASDYYIHDATGNIMAIYTLSDNYSRFQLKERHIYGSSRLGIYNRNIEIYPSEEVIPLSFTRGLKRYELSNHLGNVNSVISDRKIQTSTAGSYLADIKSYVDYYPFGYQMPQRTKNSADYRFGFNGQEKDDEIYGEGNSTTAEYWQYDARLGRRWNVDPRPNFSVSSYTTFLNNPIVFSDMLGDTVKNAVPDLIKKKIDEISSSEAIYNELVANHQGGLMTGKDEKKYMEASGLKKAKKDLVLLKSVGRKVDAMIRTFQKVMPSRFDELNNLPINILIGYSSEVGKGGANNPMSTLIPASVSKLSGETEVSWDGTFFTDIQITLWGGGKENPAKTNFLANEFGDIDYFFKNVKPGDPASYIKWQTTGNSKYSGYWNDPTGAGQHSFRYQKDFEEQFNIIRRDIPSKADIENWIIK